MKLTDQILARSALEVRDYGYSYKYFFRKKTKSYILLVAICGLVLISFAVFQFWVPFFFVLGMFCGAFLRDMGWLRIIRENFLFSLKVTDWDKVQKLADGKLV